MLQRVADAVLLLAAVGCVLVLLGTLAPVWPLALLEHFRVQYVVLGVVITLACAFLQRRRSWTTDGAALATLCHVLWLVPDLTAARRSVSSGTNLRLLMLNVHTSSTAFAAVHQLIDETNADIVALVEVDDRWIAELAPALASYTGRIESPARDNFGIALYARGALDAKVEFLGDQASIVGTVEHAASRVAIIVTHPIPPVAARLVGSHRRQLEAVGARASELTGPVLVVGDLNTTPWSHVFRDLAERGRLCDTRAGFGLQATFPASSSLLRIPIDHVLATCEVGVRNRRVERDVGSDHLPVVVDLVIP